MVVTRTAQAFHDWEDGFNSQLLLAMPTTTAPPFFIIIASGSVRVRNINECLNPSFALKYSL